MAQGVDAQLVVAYAAIRYTVCRRHRKFEVLLAGAVKRWRQVRAKLQWEYAHNPAMTASVVAHYDPPTNQRRNSLSPPDATAELHSAHCRAT